MSESKSQRLDVVYILGSGSKWSDNEIRYSLRSIEMNLPHRNVYIVGNRRSWMRNVIEIPVDDFYQSITPGFKAKNALWKIKNACGRMDLSESFILMNDDFYFLEYTPHVETFHLGPLLEAEKKGSPKYSEYDHAMRETRMLLSAMGISSPLNFGVHYPMIIEKKKFIKMADAMDWRGHQYLFRSVYGNIYERHHAIRMQNDVKVFNADDLRRLQYKNLISTSDDVVLTRQWHEFIDQKFPRPSQYEYHQ